MASFDRVPASPPAVRVTAAATFCATLVDEWVRSGPTVAFVAPGSRSSPLALALAERAEIDVHVFHDERAAAFAALGWGLRTGRPAIALCSSGTAGAHFHGAVIEASQSAVPLIVVTADRPPELWDVGAAQTIDQTHLFGGSVRWFAQPGVPDDGQAGTWRSWAGRAIAEALGAGGRPGPVHLNLSFRDPLAGVAGTLPAGRSAGRPWHELGPRAVTALQTPMPTRLGRSGVVVAGGPLSDPAAVVALSCRLGWPLLADHRSGCRVPGVAIDHFDGMLRNERFAAEHRPETVVRFGEPPASKVLNQWLADSGAELVLGAPAGRWLDPDRQAAVIVPEHALAALLLRSLDRNHRPSPAADEWRRADFAAAAAVDAALDVARRESGANDPDVARTLLASLPEGSALVAASSMAVREIEWFGAGRSDIAVYANRGANGIDGTVSTAIGIASSGVPTTCLVGDVAFLHDATALIGLAGRAIDLTIVVLDNDGGAIFGFLPQHELVPTERFELLFGTPHGTDLAALARAHHLRVGAWGELDVAPAGVRIVIAHTDREATLGLHQTLNNAITTAIG